MRRLIMKNHSIDDRLIRELKDFSTRTHADIVYRKCLRRQHFDIAERIRVKYSLPYHKYNDSVLALGLAIRYSQA